MKLKNILQAFLAAVLLATPLMAQESTTNDTVKQATNKIDPTLQERIDKITEGEPKPEIPRFWIATRMHYLHESKMGKLNANICRQPLEYKAKGNKVHYFAPTDKYEFEEKSCKGLKTFDANKIAKTIESGEVPDICTQFDIMSYLISVNDNENLIKVLDLGYEPRINIKVDGKETRWLYTQAVLSENWEASGDLNIKKAQNCKALYGSDSQDLAEIQYYDFKATLVEFFEEEDLGSSVPIEMNTFQAMIKFRKAKECGE